MALLWLRGLYMFVKYLVQCLTESTLTIPCLRGSFLSGPKYPLCSFLAQKPFSRPQSPVMLLHLGSLGRAAGGLCGVTLGLGCSA